MLTKKENQYFEKFDPNELTGLPNRVFFYPCSANDIEGPVEMFAPMIDTFWFVDINYFSHEDPRNCPPSLENNKLFDLYDREIDVADVPDKTGKMIINIMVNLLTS